MQKMRVKKSSRGSKMSLLEWIKKDKERPLFFSFIDLGIENGNEIIEMGIKGDKAGSDALVVGGSLNINKKSVEEIVSEIKEISEIPVIIFPGNTGMMSKSADGVFFPSLINSRNPYWITGAQAMSAPIINKTNVEVIPTSYIVVEPGGISSWIGDANPIPRNNTSILKAYTIYSELSGKKVICLDTGFGARSEIPVKMINVVKETTDLPLIFNGRVKSKGDMVNLTESNLDAVITQINGKSEKELEKIIRK